MLNIPFSRKINITLTQYCFTSLWCARVMRVCALSWPEESIFCQVRNPGNDDLWHFPVNGHVVLTLSALSVKKKGTAHSVSLRFLSTRIQPLYWLKDN